VIVGEVVRLREQLNWFETKPLFGQRVLVTRPKDQSGELAAALREQGAEAIEAPTIALAPPASWRPLDRALARLDRYDWLIFTSANTVGIFMQRLRAKGRDARALGGLRLCAIGPKTAEALSAFGLSVDVIPKKYQAEGVLAALGRHAMRRRRVLLPRAAAAREILPEQLRARGAVVDVVPAYRTVPAPELVRARKLLQARAVSVITFTSSSTARNLLDFLGKRATAALLRGVRLAAIGPITAKTLRDHGLDVEIVARESTSAGLVNAMVRYYGSTTPAGPAPRRSQHA
jgi:uroporphyrinogen III methyltransferase/synthase